MRRNRTPEPPQPEPWNPDEWPEPSLDERPFDETIDDTTGDDLGDTDVPTADPRPSLIDGSVGASLGSEVRASVGNEPIRDQLPRHPAMSATDAGAPSTDRRTAPAGRRGRRAAIVAGVCAGAVIVVAGAIGLTGLVGGSDDDAVGTDPVAALNSSASTSAPSGTAGSDADCPSTVTGTLSTGRDAGDQSSGVGVIKAFDHAYYVQRSAAAARALGTPTARLGSAEQMQTYINQLPAKTRHCLSITDEGKGLYAVELSEIPPGGGAPTIIRQRVQTTTADGKAWIVSIDPVE